MTELIADQDVGQGPKASAGQSSAMEHEGARQLLLVDDDDVIRELMRAILEGMGYEVLEAPEAETAMAILRRTKVSLMITDWLMPGADGPELCRRVRWEITRYVYIVMLTGSQDESALVSALEAGADEFLAKPPDLARLRARLLVGERIIRLQRELLQRSARLEITNRRLGEIHERLQKDLAAAAASQRRVLPPPGPIGAHSIAWLFRPSSVVGGDIFNVLPLGAADLMFFHIDVAGHGVRAALQSFALHNLLSVELLGRGGAAPGRAVRSWWRRPAIVVEELNRRFAASGDDSAYFTMLYGVINDTTGDGSLIQAGHPPPLLMRAATGDIEVVGEGGFPVGLFTDATYEPVQFHLDPGDRLLLYSDGVVETTGVDGTMFSEEGLLAHLAASMGEPLQSVIDRLDRALIAWRGSAVPEDDISVLALERNRC